ncbi:hypothetical protein BCR33DRAFT_717409 [Rhizoclosmatium globosum]|uniref:Uncharacterized protein n=1 Tax=Rhizoclosmatium globosum TaxID=329046 RepID=A0A1Y2C9Q4_9FUNG|nr:hypothetical protein BCR33DRAFT_717409 [Rhizoclosmatium globosum]|eukprot:ORY43763.1 hypothetical protein BCR33DRAFT_717409 [Rhizoclosmatium globosum]
MDDDECTCPTDCSLKKSASDFKSCASSEMIHQDTGALTQPTSYHNDQKTTPRRSTSPNLSNSFNTSPRYHPYAPSPKTEPLREMGQPIIPQSSTNISTSSSSSSAATASSLATLTAKVTIRLVSQFPPTIPAPSNHTQLLMDMQRFVIQALPRENISPKTPFVVMHALYLVHKILRTQNGTLTSSSSYRVTEVHHPQRQSPLLRSITHPQPSPNIQESMLNLLTNPMLPQAENDSSHQNLPTILQTPSNLLIAAFLLADAFYNDNPQRTRAWTDLVGEREFALWCSSVRRWSSGV